VSSLQNSPLESSCVVAVLIENYSTSKLLNVSPGKSQILSCDTVVANERKCLKYYYRPAHFFLAQSIGVKPSLQGLPCKFGGLGELNNNCDVYCRMIGISLVGLLFVVGRQLQLLLFDERTTGPRFLSVFPVLYRLIYDRITVSNLMNFT
jgi:hypothetical protein